MKFDYVIGNPPYQEDAPGGSTSEKPIYHIFMDAAYTVGEKVELITPARFLFNAGATPKAWNTAMLSDKNLKVLYYAANASDVFPNNAIMGGIAVTLHDITKVYHPIEVFVPYAELRALCNKVRDSKDFIPFSTIVSGRTPYLFTDSFHAEHPEAKTMLSKGHAYDISSNAFETLFSVFLIDEPQNTNNYYRVLGRRKNIRAYSWIKRPYARGRNDSYIGKWKVFLPKANGASGVLGAESARLISKPVVGMPYDIATDTFLCVGAYNTENEADALLKYMNSKFARVLLGTLKVTQINSRETWSNVPLQDFTPASDIDWSQPIPAIDRQLYHKYNLTDEEIAFIESHVKEMA